VNHTTTPSPFRQARGVLAVAFACVVSFMGIGLVEPILPALARQLKASPSQVELTTPSRRGCATRRRGGSGIISPAPETSSIAARPNRSRRPMVGGGRETNGHLEH
jgi:hypothetical protein